VSLLAIHLSGNPGLTAQNLEFLPRRIRVRPNEDTKRFKRIEDVCERLENDDKEPDYAQGIVLKMNAMTQFEP